jgi:hypothetical protein
MSCKDGRFTSLKDPFLRQNGAFKESYRKNSVTQRRKERYSLHFEKRLWNVGIGSIEKSQTRGKGSLAAGL